MKIKKEKDKYYGYITFRNYFRGNGDDADILEDGSFIVSFFDNGYDMEDVDHVNTKRALVQKWKVPMRFGNRYRERGWSGEVQEL